MTAGKGRGSNHHSRKFQDGGVVRLESLAITHKAGTKRATRVDTLADMTHMMVDNAVRVIAPHF